jgi:hypothetical protein
MRSRLWTTVAGVASVAALVAVPSAFAAYTTPKLEVTQTATGVTVKASAGVSDDATFRAQIFAPVGTTVTATQAPGTVLGTVRAQVSALALGGALLPLEGELRVAQPGQIAPGAQAQCTQGVTPTATWLMVLQAAGQTINLPLYLLPVAANETSLGAAKILVCLAPPGIPADQGGAVFGAKFLSAELTINGVFSRVATGVWIALWTPWTANAPPVNAAGSVASPAAIAPGTVTAAARRAGRGAVVSGRVTQGGQPRGGVRVTILGSNRRTGLRRVGRTTSRANGTYSLRVRTGTFFRASAVATPATAAPLCTVLQGQGLPLPCVNPTVNGFTATSATVRKR